MKGHPPIHGNRNVGFLVIIKFVLAIAISYLVYAQTIAKNGGGDTSPPSSSHKISAETDLGVDGGFCTSKNTISCPIGNTPIREAFRQAPEAADVARSNPTNRFVTVRVDDDDDDIASSSFKMLIRDPRFDTFISGFLFVGRKHDPKVHDLLVRCLRRRRRRRRNNDDDPVFIDVGANIGYFTATALALGARTISFEPSYDNAGALMSTIEENGWGDNSTLYMNALGYESNRVTMNSTSHAINKSNMHITGSECVSKSAYGGVNRHNSDGVPALYGIDYMDGVSLDQVMLSNHRNIRRVSLMKIDVETYEIHVLNGAMYSLCNLIVERIVVEVEYLKPSYNLANSCDFDRLRKALALMKYQILDLEERISYESMELQKFPTDIIFKLRDLARSPADQLRGSMENPCAQFDLNLKMK